MFQRIFYSLAAIIISGFVVSSCFKDIPRKQIVYQNNFEDSLRRRIKIYNASGLVDSPMIVTYNGSLVLGRFNNNLVSLKIDSLPEHNTIQVQFDLYIHDKWEGDHLDPITHIPDVWQLQIDKYPIYLTTFSNTTFTQSFPDNFQSNISKNPPHSDAWALLPGVCSSVGQKDGTSHYKIDYINGHISGSLTLDMNDALQPYNSLCRKSWSIDNIVVTATKY